MCGPAPANRAVSDHQDNLLCLGDLGLCVGAGEGNRTLMTSLEGWGSAIELRPRRPSPTSAGRVTTGVAYRLEVPGRITAGDASDTQRPL